MDLLNWIGQPGLLARLAELIAVNGGAFGVSELSGRVVLCEVNRYGRLGLTLQEAMELVYLQGAFDALAQGEKLSTMMVVQARIKREIMGGAIEIPTAAEQAVLLEKEK